MIQFNLLPDVKLEYIKAQRTKHLVISVSLLLSAVCLGVFLLLFFSVAVLQKKNINDLTKDIATYSQKLKGQQNLDKILTVQNQLSQLTDLHNQKVVASRLPDFISKFTPTGVTIGQLDVDFEANTMTLTGKAKSLDMVNTFVDSLKFTKYIAGEDTTTKDAFSSVVLSSFGRSEDGATYTITLSFDPIIFSSDNNVSLVVPNTITTRSVTEHPTALFEGNQ